MPNRPRRTLVLLAPALAVVALAGCSASANVNIGGGIDSKAAEKTIKEGIQKQNPNVEIKSLDCPDNISSDPGSTAECTLTLAAGNTQKVHLTVTKDGHIDYFVGDAGGSGNSSN